MSERDMEEEALASLARIATMHRVAAVEPILKNASAERARQLAAIRRFEASLGFAPAAATSPRQPR